MMARSQTALAPIRHTACVAAEGSPRPLRRGQRGATLSSNRSTSVERAFSSHHDGTMANLRGRPQPDEGAFMLTTIITFVVAAAIATAVSTFAIWSLYQCGPLDRHNNAETDQWTVGLTLAASSIPALAALLGAPWPGCIGVSIGFLAGCLTWMSYRDKLHR